VSNVVRNYQLLEIYDLAQGMALCGKESLMTPEGSKTLARVHDDAAFYDRRQGKNFATRQAKA
jgi:hypothetical protein